MTILLLKVTMDEIQPSDLPGVQPLRRFRRIRRWITILIGSTVLGIGILMVVLPGPAVVVIPVGLAILSGELVWAKKYLDAIKEKLEIKKT